MNSMSILAGFFSDLGPSFPELLDGLRLSMILTFTSLAIGLPAALVLALGVTSPRRLYRIPSVVLVEFGRGAPVLVVLQLTYYGLPDLGLTLASTVSAIAALSLMTAAYSAEYIRGGLAGVPLGEIEACHALGMSKMDSFRFVTFPQGIRIALPSLLGFSVMLFQATSLAYTLAIPELMSRAYSIGSSNFEYLRVFIVAGLLYAAISIPATWLSVLAEKRMNRHSRLV